MTPESFALVLLLTFLAVTIINWIAPPPPSRTPILVIIVLILAFIWVYGVPLVVSRR